MDNSEGGVGFPARVGIGLHAAPRLPRVVGVSRMFERGWPLPSRVGVLDQGAARAAEGEGVVKRVAWAVGAVVVPLVLGVTVVGCTTQQPGPIPTSSVVATPTTSSTSSTQPPTADPDIAAIQSALDFYEAFNRAMTTLSTDAFRKTFVETCQVCSKDADTIDQMRRQGKSLVGGNVTTSNPTVLDRSASGKRLVRLTASIAELTVKDPSGKVMTTVAPSTITRDLLLTREANAWKVELVGP